MDERTQIATYILIGILSANKFAANTFNEQSVKIAFQYAEAVQRRGGKSIRDEPIDWSYRPQEFQDWAERCGRTN